MTTEEVKNYLNERIEGLRDEITCYNKESNEYWKKNKRSSPSIEKERGYAIGMKEAYKDILTLLD